MGIPNARQLLEQRTRELARSKADVIGQQIQEQFRIAGDAPIIYFNLLITQKEWDYLSQHQLQTVWQAELIKMGREESWDFQFPAFIYAHGFGVQPIPPVQPIVAVMIGHNTPHFEDSMFNLKLTNN